MNGSVINNLGIVGNTKTELIDTKDNTQNLIMQNQNIANVVQQHQQQQQQQQPQQLQPNVIPSTVSTPVINQHQVCKDQNIKNKNHKLLIYIFRLVKCNINNIFSTSQ